MSGLAVLFHRDGRPVDAADIQQMLDAIPYRGPDGVHTRISDSIGLGHVRHVVTQEDLGEAQPLTSAQSGCVIVADARLDNRDEILDALPGAPPRSVGDAEIMLRAYDAWGLDAVPRLIGDFAFAIWDPHRRRLVCGRDASGQRMLFYRLDQRTFAAASEIHQLFQDRSVPIAPNDEHIRASFLPSRRFRSEHDSATTYFDGIFSLLAGHVLIVEALGVRSYRYWDLANVRPLRYRNEDDYAEQFRGVFFAAVSARIRSAFPVGVMLSGGMDSSSITCTAQELYRSGAVAKNGFSSFSVLFDDKPCDERDLIATITAKYGLDAHFLHPPHQGSEHALDPTGFLPSPTLWTMGAQDVALEMATRMGMRTLLLGSFADAYIGGARLVFDDLLRSGQLGEFRRHLQSYRRIADESWFACLAYYILGPLSPLSVQRRLNIMRWQREYRRYRRRLLPVWIPEPWRDQLTRRHYDESIESERARKFSSFARQSEYETFMAPECLPHPAPSSVEYRQPFADRRLHELWFALPPQIKWSPHPDTDDYYAGSKQVLRRAMRGIVPEPIRTRSVKTLFNSQVDEETGALWSACARVFGPPYRSELAARGYVDPARFWDELQALRVEHSSARYIHAWHAVRLEVWLRSLRLPRERLVTVAQPSAGMINAPTGRLENREATNQIAPS